MSWVIVGYIAYALFNPALGVLTQLRRALGAPPVNVYTNAAYWPLILTVFYLWKGLGMGSMLYFASLMGIDATLYEAAVIDGATRWQQTRHISIPSLIPLVTILSILAVGRIFGGDFGLFYQIPRNVTVLYPTTDIVETYVFRGLKQSSFGMSSAVGLIQSVMGLTCVSLANLVVRKVAPDNAMF
jgi:putative aldouronate transport system permease protein